MLIAIGIGPSNNFDVFPVVKVSGVRFHLFRVVLLVPLSSLCIALVEILNGEMFREKLWQYDRLKRYEPAHKFN